MNEKLYDMMDWAQIEGLVYSEEDQPHSILGARICAEGVLVQAFLPGALSVSVIVEGKKKEYPMEQEDEAGFFAALLPGRKIPAYRFRAVFENDREEILEDPYRFGPVITEQEAARFSTGECTDAYRILGSHPAVIDHTQGVRFAVWAPNAVRVSVVGDFNNWDGRALPMRRLSDSGIFELFVPGLSAGTLYKYEIKARGGLTFLKSDPYAFAFEVRPQDASIVTDPGEFKWTDEDWQKQRKAADPAREPMFIYEVHLGSWKKPDDGREFYTYREIAPMLSAYVKEMGYTHIELMPVMEHPQDHTAGYQTGGFYAPTSRYGTPQDLMYFMNHMHEEGIGVILDWAPYHFPRDIYSLCGFDGTNLYEHHDPRQGVNPTDNTLLFNYARPQVRNFLLSNAYYWAKEYHADGIRLEGLGYMLHVSYGREDGQWVANMYGGSENLDGIAFLKTLTGRFKKDMPDVLLFARENTAWPRVTGDPSDDALGFDFKWNDGWESDFLGYMQLDPIFRGHHHGELIFSMIYYYSEKFLNALPHDEFNAGKGTMLSRMPGRREMKFANVRAAYGYLLTHPGKKLLCMGQDLAAEQAFDPCSSIDWEDLKGTEHVKMKAYVQALLKLYRSQRALYVLDFEPDGFEWINEISANENVLVFLRKSEKEDETLLTVCNFSPLVYDNYKIGVPFAGKYKEIFNSDAAAFGGFGNVNPRVKTSRLDECDGRAESIRIKVPPMGISVFSCQKVERPESENEKARAEKAVRRPRRQVSGKGTPGTAAKTQSLKARLQKKIEEEER